MHNALPLMPPTISKDRQSVTYRELCKLLGDKLQIDIHSDAHDFQCHAIIERWDGAKWQRVWSIPAMAMETKSKLAYDPASVGPHHFAADRATLLEHATQIIGGNS